MIGEAGCYEQESKADRSRAMESKNCGVLLGGFFDTSYTSASVLAMGEVVDVLAWKGGVLAYPVCRTAGT